MVGKWRGTERRVKTARYGRPRGEERRSISQLISEEIYAEGEVRMWRRKWKSPW